MLELDVYRGKRIRGFGLPGAPCACHCSTCANRCWRRSRAQAGNWVGEDCSVFRHWKPQNTSDLAHMRLASSGGPVRDRSISAGRSQLRSSRVCAFSPSLWLFNDPKTPHSLTLKKLNRKPLFVGQRLNDPQPAVYSPRSTHTRTFPQLGEPTAQDPVQGGTWVSVPNPLPARCCSFSLLHGPTRLDFFVSTSHSQDCTVVTPSLKHTLAGGFGCSAAAHPARQRPSALRRRHLDRGRYK